MPDLEIIDIRTFREALGTFVTGVTVVTTRDARGASVGMTANSFTSVSLDPPLVLVCVGRASSNIATFAEASSFAVNILSEGQHDTAAQFARRGIDRFAGVSHRSGETGSPILQDCLAWFDCTLHQRVDAGDHMILIGRVRAFESGKAHPLGFSRGRYVQARPDDGEDRAAGLEVTAYLIEDSGRLLLRRSPNGAWTLPTAHRPRTRAAPSLDEVFGLTFRPDATFIYSIYEDEEDGTGFRVYRTALADSADPAAVSEPLRWFDIDALPWGEIRSPALRALLNRYAGERPDGSFSIYVETEFGGQIAALRGSLRPWGGSNI